MKNILLGVVCIFLCSCTSNTIFEPPKDLIPKDSMLMLIEDLYIASSAKNMKNKHKERKINYMPLVYNKYKIDSLRFEKSNFYYTSKIDDYEKMFTSVKTSLNKKKEVLEELQKQLDSLRLDSLSKKRNKYINVNDTLKKSR